MLGGCVFWHRPKTLDCQMAHLYIFVAVTTPSVTGNLKVPSLIVIGFEFASLLSISASRDSKTASLRSNRLPHSLSNAMSQKTPINTAEAPKALPGIYNQAIVANGMVFCSGVVALDKGTMRIKDGDVKSHTVCTFPNV